jgi:hypothetical protein
MSPADIPFDLFNGDGGEVTVTVGPVSDEVGVDDAFIEVWIEGGVVGKVTVWSPCEAEVFEVVESATCSAAA